MGGRSLGALRGAPRPGRAVAATMPRAAPAGADDSPTASINDASRAGDLIASLRPDMVVIAPGEQPDPLGLARCCDDVGHGVVAAYAPFADPHARLRPLLSTTDAEFAAQIHGMLPRRGHALLLCRGDSRLLELLQTSAPPPVPADRRGDDAWVLSLGQPDRRADATR